MELKDEWLRPALFCQCSINEKTAVAESLAIYRNKVGRVIKRVEETGSHKNRAGTCRSHSSLSSLPSKAINREEVRLLVFNEQDQRLLYDTETIISIEDECHKGAKLSKCGRFQFLRHRKDVPQLSRLVFGTLSTAIKKGSLKIHTVGNSLILSRVFSVPKEIKLSNSTEFNVTAGSFGSDVDSNFQYYATIRSLDALYRDDQSIRGSTTGRIRNAIDPPKNFARVRNSSLQLDGPNADEFRAFSPHRLSRARRKQMSLKGLTTEVPSYYLGSRSRLSSCSSTNEAEDTKQIGLALVFPMDQKEFIFQHILQFEEEIAILELGIHAAILAKQQFLQNIHLAYTKFCESICLLHNSTRLKTPVWLSLMDPGLQTDTALRFCDKLAELIEKLDRKETNFFLSKLLSAVLMNHLAWVASVAPPDNLTDSSNRSLLIGTNIVDGSRHPYNAMMAQFLELCGSVGLGCRVAKTVVIGSNAQLINEILFILSYFIRCSNIESKAPSNSSPVPPSSSLNDDCLSSTLLDELDDLMTIEMYEPIKTSTSFDEKLHIGLKRHSSSMSASSPPITNSQLFSSDSDSFEPPPKTRAVCSDEFKCLKPSNSHCIKLLMDVKDVRSTANELITSTFSSSFPPSTSSQAPIAGLSPSTSSSSHTISSALSNPSNDLSRSLFAGVCESYSPYFILSGINANSHKTEEINTRIYDDVRRHSVNKQFWCPHTIPLHSPTVNVNSIGSSRQCDDLKGKVTNESSGFTPSPRSQDSDGHRSQASSQEDCLSAVVVIVGDLNQLTIRAISSDTSLSVEDQTILAPSDTVISMLEQFLDLYRMNSNPNFLISFLEDQLGSILAKSHTLVEMVTSSDTSKIITDQLKQMQTFAKPNEHLLKISKKSNILLSMDDMDTIDGKLDNNLPIMEGILSTESDEVNDNSDNEDSVDEEEDQQSISMQRVSTVIGCDCSDLRLILNVAAVYNPPVLLSAL